MVIMNPEEMRSLGEEELREKVNEWRLEASKAKAQVAIGGAPENPGRIGELKRTVARALTIINERGEGA